MVLPRVTFTFSSIAGPSEGSGREGPAGGRQNHGEHPRAVWPVVEEHVEHTDRNGLEVRPVWVTLQRGPRRKAIRWPREKYATPVRSASGCYSRIASCGLAGGLHRRQQQRDQDADDRDDHQQLDQREARSASGTVPLCHDARCLGTRHTTSTFSRRACPPCGIRANATDTADKSAG